MKCYRPSGTVKMYPWYGISHDRDASGKYPGQSREERDERPSSFPTLPFAVPYSIPPIFQLIIYLLSATYILTSAKFILSSSYLFHRFPGSRPTCCTYNRYPVKCTGKQADFPCFSPVTFTKPGLSGGFTLWNRLQCMQADPNFARSLFQSPHFRPPLEQPSPPPGTLTTPPGKPPSRYARSSITHQHHRVNCLDCALRFV